MKIVKSVVGATTTVVATVGAAMTGHLVIALMVVIVMAVVVLVPMLLLVFGVLRGKDNHPAERLTALIRAWRSGGA